MKRIVTLSLISLLLIYGMFSIKRHALANQSTSAKAASVSAQQFDAPALTQKLDALLAKNSDYDLGAAVINLNGGQTYTYGETLPFIGASTTKILTATVYLHLVEEGKLHLSDKIGGEPASDLITAMIEQSDNDAWHALSDAVQHRFLQAYADGIGIHYDVSNNSLAPVDMAKLLQKLYASQLLSKTNTTLILDHMHKSIRSFIGSALDSSYTVYHKAGWLDDRQMDAAIVTKGQTAYVLVIFAKSYSGTYDFEAGTSLFGSIAQTVNQAITAQ